jgi:hypothetical protein
VQKPPFPRWFSPCPMPETPKRKTLAAARVRARIAAINLCGGAAELSALEALDL